MVHRIPRSCRALRWSPFGVRLCRQLWRRTLRSWATTDAHQPPLPFAHLVEGHWRCLLHCAHNLLSEAWRTETTPLTPNADPNQALVADLDEDRAFLMAAVGQLRRHLASPLHPLPDVQFSRSVAVAVAETGASATLHPPVSHRSGRERWISLISGQSVSSTVLQKSSLRLSPTS